MQFWFVFRLEFPEQFRFSFSLGLSQGLWVLIVPPFGTIAEPSIYEPSETRSWIGMGPYSA